MGGHAIGEDDYEHFEPVEKTKSLKLPNNLEKLAMKHFTKYKSPEVMTKVKNDCPVPKCKAFKVPKFDDDWQDILKEDRSSYSLVQNERGLTNIQTSLMATMGPLSKI